MIGLLQRVTEARVTVEGECIAAIGPGLAVLVGVTAADREANADRLAERLLGYRAFPDSAGRMNLGLAETGGGLLLVPQFTLAADTRKGRRASFTGAAPPEVARSLFERLAATARARHEPVATGRFGADMQVSLVNDGPVTFWLEG
ncbi:D-aminoacyl-tRNA deacylase [Salinisphaera sp. PC39]|uniref:D-aminoacyl-tRNA deacylase n=1 Tax=Salinisphaera sp. PC39 TaxID=1304156 RepID=UPI0033411E97